MDNIFFCQQKSNLNYNEFVYFFVIHLHLENWNHCYLRWEQREKKEPTNLSLNRIHWFNFVERAHLSFIKMNGKVPIECDILKCWSMEFCGNYFSIYAKAYRQNWFTWKWTHRRDLRTYSAHSLRVPSLISSIFFFCAAFFSLA